MFDTLPGPTKEELRNPSEVEPPAFGKLAKALEANRKPITDVENLGPKHRIILLLNAAGWSNREIAASTGYSVRRISQIVNSENPTVQLYKSKALDRVAGAVEDVGLQFRLYAGEMLNILVSHARQMENRPLSRLAARDILHMAGYAPVKKQMTVGVNAPVDELYTLLKQIQDSNEVSQRKSEWEVKQVVRG